MRACWFLCAVVALILCSGSCGHGTGSGPDGDMTDGSRPDGDAADSDAADSDSPCPTGEHDDGSGGCTSDPCLPDPCTGDRVCEVFDDQAVCQCPAGTHEHGDACVPDEGCLATTCNGHGQCIQDEQGMRCDCDLGYVGDYCESCDGDNGWVPDGTGGCTDDPCSVAQCRNDQRCVVDDQRLAQCICPGGMHDEDGRCVPDESCLPTTCNGHGECEETDSGVLCTCESGWKPPFCQECDDTDGYHSDGMGGCTTDPCLPNPCDEPHRRVCSAEDEIPVCSCDDGYHDSGGGCVEDEQCTDSTCNGHGQCTAPLGSIVCECEPGYVGDRCGDCDSDEGYHPDGQGGCTTDPCLPNPCQEDNKTQCVSSETDHICQCDAGYHPDGRNGCTDDPCLPDLCAAQNMACRVVDGEPACYTPECDDQNPCTDDSLVGGGCEYDDVGDGTGCDIDACDVGGTCESGECQNTAPLDCDDQNPCTDDSCERAAGGCVNSEDDFNNPDDGVHCTLDSCSAGIENHVVTDSRCDDARFCTGVERCQPLHGDADLDGCITTDVPSPPPAPGPCQHYGECDEDSRSFVLLDRDEGATCSDGIFCTTGDACDADGRCVGSLLPGCPPQGSCISPAAFGPIDVPVGTVTVEVTFAGGDLLEAAPNEPFSIWAVERATGGWMTVASYYPWSENPLSVTSSLMPGIYDLLYTNVSHNYETYSLTVEGASPPHGMVYLDHGVMIRAGANTISVDVAPADVSVEVTFEGEDPAVAAPSEPFTIWAVEQETGAWMTIASYYPWSEEPLSVTSQLMDGTYDLLYTNVSHNYETFSLTTAAGTPPHGMVYLDHDIVVGPGATTIAIDVQPVDVSVEVTFEGQDPVATSPSEPFTIWAVEQETGAWMTIASYYPWSAEPLSLTSRLMPGTYDLLYTNVSHNYETFSLTTPGSTPPHGMVYLEHDVVVGPGATTVAVEVKPVDVTVEVAFEGQDPVAAAPGEPFTVWAVEQETGGWMTIASYYPWSAEPLSLTSQLMPGTYDLLYTNVSHNYQTYSLTTPGSTPPHGMIFLDHNVTVGPGATTIAVDVSPQDIDVRVTLNGSELDLVEPNEPFTIWAVERETEGWMSIAYYYPWSEDPLDVTSRMMPGDYDILYTNVSHNYETYSLTVEGAAPPHGMVYLGHCISIP